MLDGQHLQYAGLKRIAATRRSINALLLVAMCMISQSGYSKTISTTKMDFASGFVELRRDMLAGHAAIDDNPVIDLHQINRCEASIVTARGSTKVRWADLGNLIVRLQKDRTLFRMPAAGKIHVLSVQTGDHATGINMQLGLLDDICGGAPSHP